MRNLFIGICTLLLGTTFTLNSCKKTCNDPSNSECENFNPCFGKDSVVADFGIYEVIGEGIKWEHILVETDTIFNQNGVVFKPKKNYDKVTWFLGLDTVVQAELYKEGFPLGWITVTMIAEANADPCLKESQLRDTLTKKFYVINGGFNDTSILKSSVWWGTWEGADTDNPNDKYTISWGFDNGMNSPELGFTGLPKGTPKQKPFYKTGQDGIEIAWALESYAGYNAMWMVSKDFSDRVKSCFGLKAIAKRKGNTVEIEYTFNNTQLQHYLNGEDEEREPVNTLSKKWIGRKVSNQVVTQ
ncbi:MAG: hypothetical protein R2852_03015 [Bacteroidia bacterium]